MRRKQEERERQLRRLARESEGSSKSNSSKPVTPSKTKEDSKASTSKDVRKPNGVPSRPLDKSSSVAQKPNPAKSEPPPSKQVPPAAKGPVPSSSARPGMSKSVLPSNTGKSPLPPPQSAKPSLKGKAVPPSREPSRPFPPSREPSRPFPPSREQSRPFPPYRRDHSMERPVQSYKRKQNNSFKSFLLINIIRQMFQVRLRAMKNTIRNWMISLTTVRTKRRTIQNIFGRFLATTDQSKFKVQS